MSESLNSGSGTYEALEILSRHAYLPLKQPVRLPTGESIRQVAMYQPRFDRVTEDDVPTRPDGRPDNFGGKPHIRYAGKGPFFPEIATVHLLRGYSGVDAAWNYSHGIFIDSWHSGPGKPVNIPDNLQELRRKLIQRRGGVWGGRWDVWAWRGNKLLFVEVKQPKEKGLDPDQVAWLQAALDEGVPLSAFVVLKWLYA